MSSDRGGPRIFLRPAHLRLFRDLMTRPHERSGITAGHCRRSIAGHLARQDPARAQQRTCTAIVLARTGAAAATGRTIIPGAANRKPRRLPAGLRPERPLRQPELPVVLRALSTLCICRPHRGCVVRARARPCAPALRRSVQACRCSRPRTRRLRSQHAAAESGVGCVSCRVGICRGRHRECV